MLCNDPYIASIGRAYPCGQCFWCRKKRARIWTHRIILESLEHTDNAFLTLTYSEEHLPAGGSLAPEDLTLFFKKLRRRIAPARLRYFAIGEYGSKTKRPHYHAALFGYPACNSLHKIPGRPCRCVSCVTVTDSWRMDPSGALRGFIQLGKLEPAGAAYIAGYVTKTLAKGDHYVEHPTGCIPPFTRSSNRPGIGAGLADDIASQLLFVARPEIQSVPGYLSHGRVKWPLGRYLRNRIRERIGVSKQEALDFYAAKEEEEMQPLREAALQAPPGQRSTAFKELLVSKMDQRRLQMETKLAIFKQRKKL